MILEAAILHVKPGQEQQFERDFKLAAQYISSIPGYQHHNLLKCVAEENKYLLWAKWDKQEDNAAAFRQSEAYQHWKLLLRHYYAPLPAAEQIAFN